MGQLSYAIMYGIKPSKRLDDVLFDSSGSGACPGLLERYEGVGKRDVCTNNGGSPLLIGFFVAVGHRDGKAYDCADMSSVVRLNKVDDGKSFLKAQRAWLDFASWAKGEGVNLPNPTLWLTELEVA